jgi:hypothetical protein
MKQSDKLKQLIETIKVSNEVMELQLDLNGRTLDLLGSLIIEPESLGKAPYSDNIPSLSGATIVGQILTIKPEDMKAGEWYVVKSWYNWMFKFRKISKQEIYTFKHISLDGKDFSLRGGNLTQLNRIKSIRPATHEEVIKYFPHEFEIPTHGGNDVPNIQQYTDEQL